MSSPQLTKTCSICGMDHSLLCCVLPGALVGSLSNAAFIDEIGHFICHKITSSDLGVLYGFTDSRTGNVRVCSFPVNPSCVMKLVRGVVGTMTQLFR